MPSCGPRLHFLVWDAEVDGFLGMGGDSTLNGMLRHTSVDIVGATMSGIR